MHNRSHTELKCQFLILLSMTSTRAAIEFLLSDIGRDDAMKADPLAEKVRSVLEERARVPVMDGAVLLRERRVMDVKVVAVPQDSTVISLEKMGSLGGIKGKFSCSRCDYLILFRLNGKDARVFIELKKKIRETSKGLVQLRMSLPYLTYLRSLCQVVFNGEKRNMPRVSIQTIC